VDVHRHWLRQEVKKGGITLNWTPTAAMVADGLTKALPPQKHKSFIKQLALQGKSEGTEEAKPQ